MELILEPKKEDFVVKEYYDANMIRKQKIMAHVHVCMHISENQLFLIFFSYFDHKFYYVNIWVKNVFKYILLLIAIQILLKLLFHYQLFQWK